MSEAVAESGVPSSEITAMGITTQRETVVAWNKHTGQPYYPAIVWQDNRTAEWCQGRSQEEKRFVKEKTGLELLPYFSASKIRWLLDHLDGQIDDVYVGTVESWLLNHLVGSAPHISDETNACRTLLYDTQAGVWSPELLQLFGIPEQILPEVGVSIRNFGTLRDEFLGSQIPIMVVCGDQQASMAAALDYGYNHGWQENFGLTKATFGTGIFLSQYVGEEYYSDDDGYTSRMPRLHKWAPYYAYEKKVADHCGALVEPLIDNPEKESEMVHLLEGFADSVKAAIADLPLPVHRLVIDGGVIRRPQLQPILQQKLGIDVYPQTLYDGTAYGVFTLLKNAVS
jgi:glycerol kinase